MTAGGADKEMEGKRKEKIVDTIQDYINEKIKKSEGEITPSPLRMVDRKLLIPEAEELFWMFANGDFEAAGPKLKVVLGEIEKIKNEKEKDSNLKFIRSFDHEIEKGLEAKTTGEFNEQDNI